MLGNSTGGVPVPPLGKGRVEFLSAGWFGNMGSFIIAQD